METLIIGFGAVVGVCALFVLARRAKGSDNYFGPADAALQVLMYAALTGAVASLLLAFVIVSYGAVLLIPLIFGAVYWYVKDEA